MPTYYSLRKKIYKRFMRSIFVSSSIRIFLLKKMGVQIGKDVYIAENFMLSDRSIDKDLIKIGDRVEMASSVTLITTSGPTISKWKDVYRLRFEPIEIKNDAWIGTGVIILPGVTIGEFAIIGAGAVVDADVPPYSYVTGNPMTVKKLPGTLINKLNELGKPK
jgi:acetyltransferase-like isoleucine patch superfamily enzyme